MATRDERRKPEGLRVRMMVDALLEAIAELERHRVADRRDLTELAAILGRLSAAEALESTPRRCPCGDMTADDCAGECGRLEAKAKDAAVGGMDYPPNVELRGRRKVVGSWVIRGRGPNG